MIKETYKMRIIVTACMLTVASLSGLAAAQSTGSSRSSATQAGASTSNSKHEAAATRQVNEAVAVVRSMESEQGMNTLLQQAKGVFIVPTYRRAALGVGGSGGEGVLLVKRDDGAWSDPAFYNIGGISVGVQAGAEGGSIAMVLNNDKAVNKFMQKNNFSLNADAGLTVVNWAKMAQGSIGAGDVVVWADTEGLFGNVATIGVNDIRFNQNTNNAYYDQTVAASDVISGKVKNPQADALKQALAATATGTASGSSGATPSSGASEGGDTGTSDSDSNK